MKKQLHVALGIFIIVASFTSCNKVNEFTDYFKDHGNQDRIHFYALNEQKLVKYSTSKPEKELHSVSISGLQANEKIVGLDFRPATGELYGLGSTSRLYTIDPANGKATLVAALTTLPAGSTVAVPLQLNGSSFGFDFNPTVDRIRIISNTGQNLRAHPVTGVTIVDGMINPGSLSANAVAYTNNDTISATATQLFALEVAGDKIYEINPPNNGTLVNPLPVGINISGDGGFDIAPRSAKVTTDYALAIFQVDDKSTLFTIDVQTGAIKILAKYGKEVLTSLAISPVQ